jgi:hypothetical protein
MTVWTIYRLLFPNEKNYIGQTVFTAEIRFKCGHCRSANAGSEYPCHRAIRKYGKEKVIVTTLCYANTKEEANELEKKYIEEYNSLVKNGKGYNQTIGGEGTNGYKFSEEQRQHASEAQQKRKETHPHLAINSSIFMKNYHKEHPDFALNHSIFMIKRALEHPEYGKEHSEKMKLIMGAIEKRKEMSDIKKAQYAANPDMARQQSELKKKLWESEDAEKMRQEASKKTQQQWKNPETRKNLMDAHRKKGTRKPFYAIKDDHEIKDEEGNRKIFTYIPDCSLYIFGDQKNAPNLGAVLVGKRNICKGVKLIYC